jgi:hypothetical protein
MSKGPRPPGNSPHIHPQESDTGMDEAPEECWTFQLVGATAAANRLIKGMPVTGSASDRKRVLVTSRGDALGFAPDAESKKIIAAAERTGGALRGQVRSDAEDTNVIVELCLRH